MELNKTTKILRAKTANGKDWYVEVLIGNTIYAVPIKQETLDFLTKTPKEVYECERCGRKQSKSFEQHGTSKIADDVCEGKVKKVSWKNSWGQ